MVSLDSRSGLVLTHFWLRVTVLWTFFSNPERQEPQNRGAEEIGIGLGVRDNNEVNTSSSLEFTLVGVRKEDESLETCVMMNH